MKNNNKKLVTAKSFNAVYDGNAKILMMGTIPSAGGVKYGFFYMSKVNKFWEYLTKTLKTDNFIQLAEDYRKHYNTESCEEYKEKVKLQGVKTESSHKKNNDKVAVKISSRKRQSARNTQKQNLYKDLDNEGFD